MTPDPCKLDTFNSSLALLLLNDYQAVYDLAAAYHNIRIHPDDLTLLDFQDLPAGRMRVRQFHFADMPCAGIGRILINGASACKGEGLPAGACGAPSLTSRTGMELLG